MYTKANLLSRLHDELVAVGIHPAHVEGKGDDIWLTVEDSQDTAAVDAVMAAHDPAAIEAVRVAAAAVETADSDAVRQAVANLQAYIDLASPTAAQTTAAVKLLARVALVVIRRVLRLS